MSAPALTNPMRPSHVPLCTYRLQMNAGFTFDQALRVLPYLKALGITDVYCSPYFGARPGSNHGYDVTDHSRVNPELGGQEAFDAFTDALKEHGMGLVMDIVPNHMSVDASGNAWWAHVLENGPSSPYARFFDIDWSPVKDELEGKVIIPLLGGLYGPVLEAGELGLAFDRGAFRVEYYEHRLPLDPGTYDQVLAHEPREVEQALGPESPVLHELQSIITAIRHLPPRDALGREETAERMREKEIIKLRTAELAARSPEVAAHIGRAVDLFNGTRGNPASFDLLDRLLGCQAFRLAYWQVATEEINYRRFFDINDLAAIRPEDPEIFAATHAMVLRHIAEGRITGLRIDHPDGLHDPPAYLHRLQQECAAAMALGPESGREEGACAAFCQAYAQATEAMDTPPTPFYVVGEKILMSGERVPADWPVSGTTGYEFMNTVGGLFVDHGNERSLTKVYEQFVRMKREYAELLYAKKKFVMQTMVAGEVNVLGHQLNRLSESDRHYRDFTLGSLTDAIIETVACFPVYRTYVGGEGASEQDVRYVEHAVGRARRRRHDLNESIFRFLRDVLVLDVPERAGPGTRDQWLAFAMKFQQITSPVMAKGMEDTLFYTFNRLMSLNEVGGHPDRFGVSREAFHGQCIERLKRRPHTMNATSTHDSKRGEDVRARISVLSEMPGEWKRVLGELARFAKGRKRRAEGEPMPSRNDEYLIYQNMLGAWPGAALDGPALEEFAARMAEYAVKAAREAKEQTTWINPTPVYEDALRAFVRGALGSAEFREAMEPFAARVAHYALHHGLGQVLLKIAAPGVPDFYQGSELWHLRLVDPDNRGAVDYDVRARVLEGLRARAGAEGREALARQLAAEAAARPLGDSGAIKLWLTAEALGARGRNPGLFLEGDYRPVWPRGEHQRAVIAFERSHEGRSFIAVAPRLLASVVAPGQSPVGEAWAETCLVLPDDLGGRAYTDVFTGRAMAPVMREGTPVLRLADVFGAFPVALLEASPESGTA
jgi:(1->4)-alpha-D-glucan 1-alpha-D-glucosylmutase